MNEVPTVILIGIVILVGGETFLGRSGVKTFVHHAGVAD